MNGLEELDRRNAWVPLTFPYVPGLLSFREAPAILAALTALAIEPDVVLIDGHGYAHPRRIGIASHVGLLIDRPTIGCAKSVLVGEFEEPCLEAGSRSPITHKGEVVGVALRTRAGVRPVYVSVGHKVSLDRAVEIVLACCDGTRISKPLREADRCVSAWKAAAMARA